MIDEFDENRIEGNLCTCTRLKSNTKHEFRTRSNVNVLQIIYSKTPYRLRFLSVCYVILLHERMGLRTKKNGKRDACWQTRNLAEFDERYEKF